jgi:hypothetical protein
MKYTSYGVAAAVARIVRGIVRDEKRILMDSVPAAEDARIGGAVLTVPCVGGRGGVEFQLILGVSQDEHQRLQRSAAVLEAACQSLTGPGGPARMTPPDFASLPAWSPSALGIRVTPPRRGRVPELL